eukprot:jgi/Mesvir1/4191/Mv08899-RA.1
MDTSNWLVVGCLVEAHGIEEGFQGSWAKAKVKHLTSKTATLEYTDYLGDDGKSPLVEDVHIYTEDVKNVSSKSGFHHFPALLLRPASRPDDYSLAKIQRRENGLEGYSLSIGEWVEIQWRDTWWEAVVLSKPRGKTVNLYYPGRCERDDNCSLKELRLHYVWVGDHWERRPQLQNLVQEKATCEMCDYPASKVQGVFISETLAGPFYPGFGERCLWVHDECMLFTGSAELVKDGLINEYQLMKTLMGCERAECALCSRKMAAVRCVHKKCKVVYHWPCAYIAGCRVSESYDIACPDHSSDISKPRDYGSRIPAIRKLQALRP